MAAVAAHKGIHPGKMEVRVARETALGSPWHTSFSVQIDLGAKLDGRELRILYNSARRCEVHKLLSGEVQFEYGWRDSNNTGGHTAPRLG